MPRYNEHFGCFLFRKFVITRFSNHRYNKPIGHFTVVCLVTWPCNENEAGDDLVLIQTSLAFHM